MKWFYFLLAILSFTQCLVAHWKIKYNTHTRGAHDLISECIHTILLLYIHVVANSMDMTTISIAIWITLYFYQRRRLRRRHWKKFFNHDLHKIYPCWSSIVTWKNICICCWVCCMSYIFMNEWKSRRMTSEERKIRGYFWPSAASHETRTL